MATEDAMLTDIMVTTDLAQTVQPAYVLILREINKYVVNILLALIMLAMGCVVRVEDFKVVIRRPIGACIGLACQFFILPLVAFILAHALQLKPTFALGMLISASCPGGTTSSLQTHWANGDVCLSIVMTTISTVAALGMLPFNLWLYSRSWTDSIDTTIPYRNILIALVLIIIPVGVGMIIKWKSPKVARVVTLVGSLSGLGMIGVNTAINCIINPDLFSSPWTLWAAAVLLSACGYTIGYLIALLLRQKSKERRTISFETGTQNAGVALSLIVVTFGDSPLFFELVSYPTIFAVILTIEAFSLVGFYVLYDKHYNKLEDGEEDERGDGVSNPAMVEEPRTTQS